VIRWPVIRWPVIRWPVIRDPLAGDPPGRWSAIRLPADQAPRPLVIVAWTLQSLLRTLQSLQSARAPRFVITLPAICDHTARDL
jgi:hypothetical protein